MVGSEEEREAFRKANHQNKRLQQQENEGLHLSIKVSTEMRKGCDFDVFALVTNNTQSEKKCRLRFGSCVVTYNGHLGGNCGFKDLLNVELAPGAGEQKNTCVYSWICIANVISIIYCLCSFRKTDSTKAELLKVW